MVTGPAPVCPRAAQRFCFLPPLVHLVVLLSVRVGTAEPLIQAFFCLLLPRQRVFSYNVSISSFLVSLHRVQFADLSNEVEIRKQELTLLADRLGQSSHSQLEAQLEETSKSLAEETKAVEEAKAAGIAAVQRSVRSISVSFFCCKSCAMLLALLPLAGEGTS